MRKKKLSPLGTVFYSYAKLYDIDMNHIANCFDTPNAISKALMELATAAFIREGFTNELKKRQDYESRMQDWNIAPSYLNILKG